jgi:cytochrome c5
VSLNNTLKAARGCDRCGYRDNVRALEWAHRDDATAARTRTGKRILPADMLKPAGDGLTRYALRVWLQDIEGCDLLCATCHREDTFPQATDDAALLRRALDALDAIYERPTTIMGRMFDQGQAVHDARCEIKALLNHLKALED